MNCSIISPLKSYSRSSVLNAGQSCGLSCCRVYGLENFTGILYGWIVQHICRQCSFPSNPIFWSSLNACQWTTRQYIIQMNLRGSVQFPEFVWSICRLIPRISIQLKRRSLNWRHGWRDIMNYRSIWDNGRISHLRVDKESWQSRKSLSFLLLLRETRNYFSRERASFLTYVALNS